MKTAEFPHIVHNFTAGGWKVFSVSGTDSTALPPGRYKTTFIGLIIFSKASGTYSATLPGDATNFHIVQSLKDAVKYLLCAEKERIKHTQKETA